MPVIFLGSAVLPTLATFQQKAQPRKMQRLATATHFRGEVVGLRGTDTGSVEIADADTRSVFLTLLLAALGSPLLRFV
jgi:hypothetical protein